MRSAVGAKGMKIEGARSEGSGGRRIEDFLGKEDSPSRSASRWHRSICCSFFSPSFSFITPNSRPRESLFLSLPVSLLLPPFSLFLPPSLPSPLSPDIFLSSRIFSPLVLSSFSLSFDFSLDFFENAAPIHHRRATIIMQSVLALKNRSRSIRRRRSPGTHRSRFSRSTIEFLRESNTRPIVTDFLTEFLFFHQNRTSILLESRLSGGNKNGVRVRSSSDRFGDRKENRGNRLLVLVVSRTRERIAKKTNKILTISDKLRNFFSL